MLPVGTHIPVMIDSETVAVTEPMDAVRVEEPSDTPVERPVVGPTVATAGVLDVHVAEFVTFAVVPSEYVPLAVNCWSSPTPEFAGFGAITVDSTIAGVTFSVALPDTDPDFAVTTVEPIAIALASPELELTVPIAGLAEVQLTLLVKSAVVVSEYVPVALSCSVSPAATLGAATLGALGVTAMESNVVGVEESPPPPRAVSTVKRAATIKP